MVLMDIYCAFEERKKKMSFMLKSNNGSIALEKRQEIQGALNEIEIFLNTLQYYNNKMSIVPEPKAVPRDEGFWIFKKRK